MFHWFFIEGLHLHNVLTIDVFPSHHVSVHRFEYPPDQGSQTQMFYGATLNAINMSVRYEKAIKTCLF
jgi:hypothetical protein